MRLDWLALSGFRGHASLEFAPDPGTNVLTGDNGAGKTSILEAIGYLVALTSFRRAPDKALVAVGASEAVIRGGFEASGRQITVEVEVPVAGRRRTLVNGKRARTRAAAGAAIAIVTFLPDDLDIVKRGPGMRRELADDLAAQLWPAAAIEQADFERALRQRNSLLRAEGRRADPVSLDTWDERLSQLGAKVMMRRLEALRRLTGPASETYSALGEASEALSWRYVWSGGGELGDPGIDVLAQRLAEALAEARRRDMERRATTVGPHRDEISIMLGERDTRTRSSQGEQRSIALSLRVGAHRLLRERRGAPPILLLDDVFSELDPGRGRRLVELLPPGQSFITSAHAEDVPVAGKRWRVAPSRVTAS